MVNALAPEAGDGPTIVWVQNSAVRQSETPARGVPISFSCANKLSPFIHLKALAKKLLHNKDVSEAMIRDFRSPYEAAEG